MRRLALFGGLLLLGVVTIGAAPRSAVASNYTLTASGPWVSDNGILNGTWEAHFDVAGFDLSGTLNLIGMPGVGEGNIHGSWDLDEIGFGVLFLDQELATFTGGLVGNQFQGTFDTGDIRGTWSGLLENLSFTTAPIAPVIGGTLPTLVLSHIDGRAGQIINLAATLFTQGASVANIENLISFDSLITPIQAKADGTPDCSVNPLLDKANSLFQFLPEGCRGSACTQVRAVIASLSNAAAIANGAQVYTCKVRIATDVTGIYQLVVTALKGLDANFSSINLNAIAGEVGVRTKKLLDCHCSTVGESGPLPLASLLAPLLLVIASRRSRRKS